MRGHAGHLNFSHPFRIPWVPEAIRLVYGKSSPGQGDLTCAVTWAPWIFCIEFGGVAKVLIRWCDHSAGSAHPHPAHIAIWWVFAHDGGQASNGPAQQQTT
eukprot:scaffold343263_cov20-Prasinocladus_malaysianus.AAC.1